MIYDHDGLEIILRPKFRRMRFVKKLLVKLSVLPALAMVVALSAPVETSAQTTKTCPTGTFQCTCNGIRSCQSSVDGCWNSC
jgi:hypothetical protein